MNDKFWKYFLIACATLLIGGGATAYGLVQYVAPQQLPAIVLPSTNDLVDSTVHAQTPRVATTSEYFFRESVPFGFDHWSWGTVVDWRNGAYYFEGTHSLAVTFTEPWGGIGIEGPGTITKSYNGISLALYAEPGVENLYVELHDTHEKLIGRQAISWYSPERKLATGRWYQVTIPLINFGGYLPAHVARVSILARGTGKAYFDSIKLVRNAAAQERWEPKSEEGGDPTAPPTVSELLLQSAQAPLPYELQLTPIAAGLWYAMSGTFQFAATEALLGMTPQGTDSTALFLGGRRWTNYRADAVVNWGTPTTFSLLARFVDDRNYASCAFSGYGMYMQIYHMKDGEFKMVAEAPELSIPHFDQWKEVHHGVEVVGNTITCYLNGERVLSADLSGLPSEGTAGMAAWSRDPGGVPHRVQSFKVSPR